MGKKGAAQYQTMAAATGIEQASPHKLIQMLLAGAIARISAAKGHIERGQTADKGLLLGKALSIVQELQTCLDRKTGGEMAQNLYKLYDYILRLIIGANTKSDEGMLGEAVNLLREIKEGWDAIPNRYRDKNAGTITQQQCVNV